MPFFHLRVDPRSEKDRDANIDFIKRLAGKHRLVVKEFKSVAGTEHYHAIFEDSRSESRVRAQWKEKFPDYDGKIKKEYQFKEIPEQELHNAEKYLCKGESPLVGPDIVLQTGKYTVEKTVELHCQYWQYGGPQAKLETMPSDPNQTTMTNFTVTHTVQKIVKAKQPNFYERFIESINLKYREESGGHYVDRDWKLTDTPLVLKELLRHHGKHFRPYDVSLFEKEMNLIMGILTFDSHWSDFYEQLKNRRNIPHL